MLKGQELLSFVKANVDMDQYEIARAAGYVRVTEKGTERVMINKLNEALLEAKGLKLKSSKKPGKVAQYMTTVHRTGVILVGKTYSQKFGVEPGDELKIVVDDDCIRLVPQLSDSSGAATPVDNTTLANMAVSIAG